jgi:hypothetical protein
MHRRLQFPAANNYRLLLALNNIKPVAKPARIKRLVFVCGFIFRFRHPPSMALP